MEAPAPLNVLGFVGDALRDVFGQLAGLARIAWAWYALAAAFALLGLALATSSPLGDLVASIVGGGTVQVILSLAVLACVVRWQRHIVLGEPLRGMAPLNRPVLRYAVWSLALGLICLLPVVVAGLIAFATGAITSNDPGETPFSIDIGGIALLAIGGLLALLLFARLNLVLPGGERRRSGVRSQAILARDPWPGAAPVGALPDPPPGPRAARRRDWAGLCRDRHGCGRGNGVRCGDGVGHGECRAERRCGPGLGHDRRQRDRTSVPPTGRDHSAGEERQVTLDRGEIGP